MQLERGSVCRGDNSYLGRGKGEKDTVGEEARAGMGELWMEAILQSGGLKYSNPQASAHSCTTFELQDSKSANDFLGEVVLRCVLHGKCTAISSGRGTSCPQKRQAFPLES